MTPSFRRLVKDRGIWDRDGILRLRKKKRSALAFHSAWRDRHRRNLWRRRRGGIIGRVIAGQRDRVFLVSKV